MPKLHIHLPDSAERTIDLTKNLMSIGRTDDNDICIPDPNISKRHGMLVRDGDEYQLHDFNSTNGTFVNGERIMAVKLQHGTSIRVGPIEMRYESTPAKPAVAPLGLKQPEPGLLRRPESALQRGEEKERGMSKRQKPEYAGGKLQTGPVVLRPGFSAKPIPPPDKT